MREALKRLLCRVGIHNMMDLQRDPWNGVTQTVVRECVRCGKSDTALFISPLSGPRKGPMHPRVATLKREDRD